MSVELHPLIDGGVDHAVANPSGGILSCRCAEQPVRVEVATEIGQVCVCGCPNCWKPAGAKLAIVSLALREGVAVADNGEKLTVVDETAPIRRHQCSECGVHLFGRVDDMDHPFHGVDLIHPELFNRTIAPVPGFALFVALLGEAGRDDGAVEMVRTRLRELGIIPHDYLSPALMEVLGRHAGG